MRRKATSFPRLCGRGIERASHDRCIMGITRKLVERLLNVHISGRCEIQNSQRDSLYVQVYLYSFRACVLSSSIAARSAFHTQAVVFVRASLSRLPQALVAASQAPCPDYAAY